MSFASVINCCFVGHAYVTLCSASEYRERDRARLATGTSPARRSHVAPPEALEQSVTIIRKRALAALRISRSAKPTALASRDPNRVGLELLLLLLASLYSRQALEF